MTKEIPWSGHWNSSNLGGTSFSSFPQSFSRFHCPLASPFFGTTMDPEEEARRKSLIEETVLEVLRKSNLEDMTEFRVRDAASHRLGIDLSDLHSRILVRTIVESFLLSDESARGNGADGACAGTTAAPDDFPLVKKKDEECVMCKLANKRYVALYHFKGTRLLSIRDYYDKDGQLLPSAKGISLTREQWSSFKNNLPTIQKAIEKIHSKLSFQPVTEELKDVPVSSTSFASGLVPLEIRRFDGKNYASWAHQMEILLNQLNIAYVLNDPCPSVTLRADATHNDDTRSKAAELKWLNDDYICRRNILSSLSDCLYYKYSEKTKTARDLWEQLRLVYLYEDCKTRISLVKKYIEFQMTDEKPMSQQAQALNDIADSFVASGVPVDESFHVRVIVSKLPASWKDLCSKLTRHENLSFGILMDHLRAEDELQKQHKFKQPYDTPNSLRSEKLGYNSNGATNPKETLRRKRVSDQGGKRGVCYICRKRGHFAFQCQVKRSNKEGNSSQSPK